MSQKCDIRGQKKTSVMVNGVHEGHPMKNEIFAITQLINMLDL